MLGYIIFGQLLLFFAAVITIRHQIANSRELNEQVDFVSRKYNRLLEKDANLNDELKQVKSNEKILLEQVSLLMGPEELDELEEGLIDEAPLTQKDYQDALDKEYEQTRIERKGKAQKEWTAIKMAKQYLKNNPRPVSNLNKCDEKIEIYQIMKGNK